MYQFTKNEQTMIDIYRGKIEEDFCVTRDACSFEDFITPWREAKENLFDLFGDKLVLEKEIDYGVSEWELVNQMKVEIIYDTPFYNLRLMMTDKLCVKSENILIQSFTFTLFSPISLAYNSCIFSSTDDKDIIIGSYETDDTIKISSGKPIKPFKLMKKIINLLHLKDKEEVVEQYRLKHSRILGKKEKHSVLCLSIHPLDYITMSENNCGWISCLNWSGGEYRSGTVEMMNSPMVVVGYLKSKTDMHVAGNLFWSNKRWRCLFLVTQDYITSIKSYPFEDKDLIKMCCNWLRDLSKEKWGVDHTHVHWYSYNKGFKRRGVKILPRFYSENMYNDFGCTCNGIHWGCIRRELLTKKDITITDNYSGLNECVICGNENDANSEDDLICPECRGVSYCSDCFAELSNSNDKYYYDGKVLCEYCYNKYFVEDAVSGNIVERENTIHIWLKKDIMYLDSIYIEVNDSENVEEILKPYVKDVGKIKDYEIPSTDELTDKGWHLFHFQNAEQGKKYYENKYQSFKEFFTYHTNF